MRWIEFAWLFPDLAAKFLNTRIFLIEPVNRAERRGKQRWTRREYIHVGSCRPSMASNGPSLLTPTLSAWITAQPLLRDYSSI